MNIDRCIFLRKKMVSSQKPFHEKIEHALVRLVPYAIVSKRPDEHSSLLSGSLLSESCIIVLYRPNLASFCLFSYY